MTQQNSKLPLGIQDFEEMRRDYYILLIRPIWFGNWLMVLNTIT